MISRSVGQIGRRRKGVKVEGMGAEVRSDHGFSSLHVEKLFQHKPNRGGSHKDPNYDPVHVH